MSNNASHSSQFSRNLVSSVILSMSLTVSIDFGKNASRRTNTPQPRFTETYIQMYLHACNHINVSAVVSGNLNAMSCISIFRKATTDVLQQLFWRGGNERYIRKRDTLISKEKDWIELLLLRK